MFLTEQLQLLSINPRTNKPYIRTVSYFPVVLSGALLGDLYINQHIQLDKNKVIVMDKQSNDPLLKEALEKMSEPKSQPIKFWLQRLQKCSKETEKIINYLLIQKDMIAKTTSIFNKEKYEVNDKKRTDQILKMKSEIKTSLSKFQLGQQIQQNDQKQLLLLMLIDSAKLLSIVFTNNSEQKQIKKQLKKIKSSSLINKEIQSAIDAIDTLNAAAGTFMM